MDFSKTKPSKNVVDRTGILRIIMSDLLSRWDPQIQNYINQSDNYKNDRRFYDWTPEQRIRLGNGEDVLNILRERMRNDFFNKFIGLDDSQVFGRATPKNFDFHKEDFDTHSNMRKRSQGSSYDNY